MKDAVDHEDPAMKWQYLELLKGAWKSEIFSGTELWLALNIETVKCQLTVDEHVRKMEEGSFFSSLKEVWEPTSVGFEGSFAKICGRMKNETW